MEAVGIRVHSLEAELARVLGLKQEEAARAEAEVGVLKAKLHKLDGELATTREAARQCSLTSWPGGERCSGGPRGAGAGTSGCAERAEKANRGGGAPDQSAHRHGGGQAGGVHHLLQFSDPKGRLRAAGGYVAPPLARL
eukprot:9489864-Pyramimonas_sp.AAC.1